MRSSYGCAIGQIVCITPATPTIEVDQYVENTKGNLTWTMFSAIDSGIAFHQGSFLSL